MIKVKRVTKTEYRLSVGFLQFKSEWGWKFIARIKDWNCTKIPAVMKDPKDWMDFSSVKDDGVYPTVDQYVGSSVLFPETYSNIESYIEEYRQLLKIEKMRRIATTRFNTLTMEERETFSAYTWSYTTA